MLGCSNESPWAPTKARELSKRPTVVVFKKVVLRSKKPCCLKEIPSDDDRWTLLTGMEIEIHSQLCVCVCVCACVCVCVCVTHYRCRQWHRCGQWSWRTREGHSRNISGVWLQHHHIQLLLYWLCMCDQPLMQEFGLIHHLQWDFVMLSILIALLFG